MPETRTPVAVALLYQTSQFGGHLRDALKELGAAVVYEALTADIDRDKLEGSGARVVIVNLDPDTEAYIDHVYDLLDEGDYQVVFNEAQVSANLSGWDHARWARNLAAKILKQPGMAEPPRPPGAEAVPTPVQKSASFVPVAEKPGEHAGAKLVSHAPLAIAAVVQTAPSDSSERPTVEMPLPEFVQTELLRSADLGIADLAEFAQLAEPDIAAPGDVTQYAAAPGDVAQYAAAPGDVAQPVAAAPSEPQSAVADSASDFAAELDALFAAADAARPTPAEDDLSLPADFDLAEDLPPDARGERAMDIEAIDIPFDLAEVDQPIAALAVTPTEHADLHTEFPAIFDQLDVAAATIPEAIDGTFKPVELPVRAHVSANESERQWPTEWSLELLDDGADATASPAAAPAKPFGIEKMSAADFLAPHGEEATAEQQLAAPAGGPGLELVPMEEALAPTEHAHAHASEARLDASGPPQKLKVGNAAGVRRVFVLGASIGGPEAVRDFLGALPAGFPVLFVLAQHMGEEFLELMSAQLAKAVALTVRNPTHGEHAGHGEVLVVPATHRLQVDAEGVVTLAHLPGKTPYSPSIDQVLRDVADEFGDRAGAIVFSGMAHDAIEGSQYLKSRGGVVWVQDPETCVVSSMVDGARAAGVVDFLGSPKQLAAKMIADYGTS